jgi:hypothetical protein
VRNKTGKLSIAAIVILSVALVLAVFAYVSLEAQYLKLNGSMGISFTCASLHTKYTFEKDGKVVFQQYHDGAVTNLGLNTTLAKLTGYSTYYNDTVFDLYTTWVGIGDKGSLDADSVILPGEWNRTSATIHDATYNSFNLTAVFHPDTGPYTADCIGVYYEGTEGGGPESLWGYDTFNEVTGIDETFTITIEIKISVS